MEKSRLVSLLLLLASLSGLPAQGFSSIGRDLDQLESLIADTLLNSQEQQKMLEGLKQSLDEKEILIDSRESIITERESLLQELQAQLIEISEIYRTQSALSAKYERSSKFWKVFTAVGIPAAAVISGVFVWASMQR